MKRFSVSDCHDLFFLASEAKLRLVYITEWKSEANKSVCYRYTFHSFRCNCLQKEGKSDAASDSGIWFFTEWKRS
ncbi:MAG: hypothetical protein IPL12_20865 [Bacteroidetes bacterium]|nr:hypothetical protein [Bacteroidota bacterium]